MGSRVGNRNLGNVKLIRGTTANIDPGVVYSNLDGTYFDINHYSLTPAVPATATPADFVAEYGEERLEKISPYLLELEEDEAAILLKLLCQPEPRAREEWLPALKKANYHFSDALNNPFNKHFSHRGELLKKMGLLEELRRDGYGNTHYAVNRQGKLILEILEKLHNTLYFPLQEDTTKEEFYYAAGNWANFVPYLTRERYNFSLANGGFATYQGQREGHVFDLTKYAGNRISKQIPAAPQPFTYDHLVSSFAVGNYRSAINDFWVERGKYPEYSEFYQLFRDDWTSYEFLERNTQKPLTKFLNSRGDVSVDEVGLQKNFDYTKKAMQQHLNELLSGDVTATEMFPIGGVACASPYAWDEDTTLITLQSRNSETGELKTQEFPFNSFAKFYDRRSNCRFVDLRKTALDEKGEEKISHLLGIFEKDKMVGLIKGHSFDGVPLRHQVVDYYTNKYPALRQRVHSHYAHTSTTLPKLDRAK